jgi:hypothetical protein
MTRRLAQLAETWRRWPDGWIARSSMMSIVIMISIVITIAQLPCNLKTCRADGEGS